MAAFAVMAGAIALGMFVNEAPPAIAITAAAEPDRAAAAARDRTGTLLLVVDSSGSMAERASRSITRMQAAKSALNRVVDALPGDGKVGLRTYGATIASGPRSCRDSQLVVPIGSVDRAALHKRIDALKPLGNTPIAYSLEQAGKDLPREGPRTVLLVSDGEETCGGNPCAVARRLSAQGVDVRIDVVGFQVGAKARGQLTCVAQAGRGTYYDAPNAGALTSQLARLSGRAARAYEPAGIPVEGTDTPAGAPLLETGQYLDTLGEGAGVEYYRTNPPAGSTLHVGATLRPTSPNLTASEQIEVDLLGASGEPCVSARTPSLGAFDRLTPISASLTADAKKLQNCGAAPYTVRVQGTEGVEVKPLEIVVAVEPAVTDRTGLPPAAQSGGYDVRATVNGTPTQVLGSPTLTSAPKLQPGVYTDSILVGETLFYRVDLDWGQQLVCDLTFGESRSFAAGRNNNTPTAKALLYGPLRGEIVDLRVATGSAFYRGDADVAVHLVTPPVRYLNRTAPSLQPASLPGPYYCAVFLNGDPDLASLGEIPVTLTVDVTGTAGEGAPRYAAAAPSLDATPSASASADAGAGASGGSADEAGSSVIPWVIGGEVLLVATAGALLWGLNRRRGGGEPSTEPEREPATRPDAGS